MPKVDVPAILKDLEGEVRAYFRKNIHAGYVKPFELERLEPQPHPHASVNPQLCYAVPRGVDEEDIDKADPTWSKGLLKIGSKYGFYLALPPWVYET